MEKAGKKPNFLLLGFILISLVIHFLILLHVAGIYESRTISYIELSMHQLARPDVRRIPKPRLRGRTPEMVGAKSLQMQKFPVPDIRVDKSCAHKAHKIDKMHEPVNLPQVPGSMDVSKFYVPGLKISSDVAKAGVSEAPVEFVNARDYFEMIHLRIHSFKKYPKSAKLRHLEGRVNVQFVLKNLDDAAIDAIKKASPFPRPPPLIFKPPVTLKIDILFELA